MFPIETSTLQTILTLFFAFVFVALAGLSGLVRYWQGEVREDLRQARQYLRRQEMEERKLKKAYEEDYSVGDPEPFGSRVSGLMQAVDEYALQVQVYRNRYIRIQEAVNRTAPKRLNRLLAAPMDWQRIRKQVAGLQVYEDKISKAWFKIDGQIQDLEEVAWDVSVQLRDAFERYQEVDNALAALSEHQVHGEAFISALSQQDTLHSALARVPELFFQGSKEEVLELNDRESVARLHQSLDEHVPKLERRAAKVIVWNDQLNSAAADLQVFQESSQELAVLLNNAPGQLEVQPIQQRLDHLVEASSDLAARIAAPLVEDLQTCAREAHQARRVIEELHREYVAALDQMQELPGVVAEISEGVHKLQERYSSLEKSPFYPFVWDISRPRFGDLQQQLQNITAEGAKSPEQFKRDVSTARLQLTLMDELIETSLQVEKDYPALVSRLESMDRQEMLEWCNDTRKLTGEVREYNLYNWEKKEDVEYQSDLKAIEERLLADYPPSPATRIIESEYQGLLLEANRFAGLYEALRGQTAQVRRQLNHLQDLEFEGLGKLRLALKNFNELGLMAANNTLLEQILKSRMPALQREAEDLVGNLEKRSKGNVEAKSKKVADLVERVEKEAQKWQEEFDSQLTSDRQQLQAALDTLQGIAPLEEPLILEGQQILSDAQTPQEGKLTLDGMNEVFKGINQAWFRLDELGSSLKEIEQPVIDAHRQMEEQRQTVSDTLERAKNAVPESSWSSGSLALGRVHLEFEAVERDLTKIEKQPTTAEGLVSKLEKLTERFETTAEKARQLASQAEREDTEVRRLKRELEDLIGFWNELIGRFADDLQVQNEIEDLVGELSKRLNKLEKRQQRDPLNHQQVVRELRGLIRHANDTTVSTGDGRLVDVNGEIIS